MANAYNTLEKNNVTQNVNRRRRSHKHDCCNHSGLHRTEVWHRHYTTYTHTSRNEKQRTRRK